MEQEGTLQATERETSTLTQSQNPQPAICPPCKICKNLWKWTTSVWFNCFNLKLRPQERAIAPHWLESQAMETGWPRDLEWNQTLLGNKIKKWFLIIFWYTHRSMSCPVFIRETSYRGHSIRHCIPPLRDQGMPRKRSRKDNRRKKGWRTGREHATPNQLSGAHIGSQRLKWKAWDLHGSTRSFDCFCQRIRMTTNSLLV